MSTMATRDNPRAIPAAAATATLLNRQNPMALSRSAWWPGGRTSANAVSRVSSACSAACTAAAAAIRSNTSARSGRSGCPGGVVCSWKRCEAISSMTVSKTNLQSPRYQRLLLEGRQRSLELQPLCLDRTVGSIGHDDRLADGHMHPGKRLRHLRLVPALHRPEPIGLDVERQDRLPRGAGEKYRAGLRDARGAPWAVDRERGRPAGRQLPP